MAGTCRMQQVCTVCLVCRCAENYRQLCTGESGVVPVDDKQREGAGKARHFKVTIPTLWHASSTNAAPSADPDISQQAKSVSCLAPTSLHTRQAFPV